MYVRKIEKIEGLWADFEKKREFKNRVKDKEYKTEVRTQKGTFEKLIKSIEAREIDLETEADAEDGGALTRRFVCMDESDSKSSGSISSKNEIPFLPNFLLQSLLVADKENSQMEKMCEPRAENASFRS